MKNTFTWIIIVLAVLFILNSKGCLEGDNTRKGPDTLRVVDTTWLQHDSIIYRKVPVIHEIPVPIASQPQYLPDPEYPKLKAQYEELAKNYLAKRVYKDSVAVGKFGYIHVVDTVKENKLLTRKFQENYKIPVVKETMTITKYEDPKRQVYLGGGISGNQTIGPNQVHGGLLLKNKKDQIFGVQVNYTINQGVSYGVSSYFKLKFK